ncbi:MAG: alpha/beta hydrolase [Chloroflexota bacterium]|nr:alpha/beta hydrolase [Chloroflexota bacterium]
MITRKDHNFTLRHFLVLMLVAAGLTVSPLGALTQVRAAAVDPEQRTPQIVRRDVVYCTGDSAVVKMDIYEPHREDTTPVPAAMFVHGGSWTGGDKASGEGAPEIADLVSRGYLVASINYRLYPQFSFPAPIEDAKCAVRYLRANSSSLGIDPARIGAWGASAGAQLAALVGTADSTAGMEGVGGYSGVSSRVQAVVDMYGRADLAEVPQSRPDLLPVFGGESRLAGFSPVTYVSKDDPPFLIIHGAQDATVPVGLSLEFSSRLKAVGVPVTLVVVQNAGHGFTATGGTMSPSRDAITRMVGDFFDRYLKSAPKAQNVSALQAQPLPAGGDQMQCQQTGKSVRGIFLDYWRTHGGIAQQGLPISGEMQEQSTVDGKAYTVQYFERAVLEYHPDNRGAKSPEVLASLLGAQAYHARYSAGAPGQRPDYSEGSAYFPQTGHRLGGAFLEYWRQHGDVMQQGYPVSDQFSEVSPLDGETYTVQYFERAVFEFHTENDPANQVQLSQLGTFKMKQKIAPSKTARP